MNGPEPQLSPSPRRTGDAVAIPGDYQARALHQGFVVQRFWHALKLDLIDRVLPPQAGARVLDVGCGSGVIAHHLAARAAHVDAVDANPSAIAYARAAYANANLHYHLGYVDALAFPDESFDQAYCLEVIEHIYEPQVRSLLSRLARLLRPGGTLLLTTPNYHSLWPLIEWALDALQLAPRMQHEQHVFKLSRARLQALGRAAGLDQVRLGRFCGAAPFASVISWRVAAALNRLENRFGNPLGNLLFAVWRRAGAH